MGFRAIIFDFDGVLVESGRIKTAAFARLFAAEGLEAAARIVAYHEANGGVCRFEKFRTIYREILRRPLDEATHRRLCAQFAALVVEAIVAAPWVPGAQEFLSTHRARYRFFIVSGTPEEELRHILRRRAMYHYFEDVRGAPDPKPILLEQLLERHHLAPRDVVCIGDSSSDWWAARQAGIPFIWRHAPETPPLDGYDGPGIPSLIHLEACLFSLAAASVASK